MIMKITSLVPHGQARRRAAAFSLVEVTIGMAVIGMTTAALFSGFASGLFTIQMARENLRATQIMLEKTETIRLYNWSQINSNFVPPTFTEAYDPQSSIDNQGIVYNGTVTIGNAPFTNSYSDNVRMVTVRVTWKTGELNRSREFSTLVARDGLQDYIF
jgi:type II secretory pathway pseudopilin PulG